MAEPVILGFCEVGPRSPSLLSTGGLTLGDSRPVPVTEPRVPSSPRMTALPSSSPSSESPAMTSEGGQEMTQPSETVPKLLLIGGSLQNSAPWIDLPWVSG